MSVKKIRTEYDNLFQEGSIKTPLHVNTGAVLGGHFCFHMFLSLSFFFCWKKMEARKRKYYSTNHEINFPLSREENGVLCYTI